MQFSSSPTSEMLEQQILAQFSQDTVIASYDLMLYSRYYDFSQLLIERYFEEIMAGSPVAPLGVNKNLAFNFITSDWFVKSVLKMKDKESFSELSDFFSSFILESVANEQIKSKNLDLLVEIFA
jgi:hypothetical protein